MTNSHSQSKRAGANKHGNSCCCNAHRRSGCLGGQSAAAHRAQLRHLGSTAVRLNVFVAKSRPASAKALERTIRRLPALGEAGVRAAGGNNSGGIGLWAAGECALARIAVACEAAAITVRIWVGGEGGQRPTSQCPCCKR
jgi:hypothetical protein